jgi:hypothetical protein
MMHSRSAVPATGLSRGLLLFLSSFLRAADCNQNGTPDALDIGRGTSRDCNRNAIPDECDLLPQSLALVEVASVAVDSGPVELAAADFDGDQDIDLASASAAGGVSILTGNGDGTLGTATRNAVGQSPVGLTAGDLDGDGDIDLAAARSFSLELFENDGEGRFTLKASLPAGSNPVAIIVADMEGDGDTDIVTANSLRSGQKDNVTVFLNAGGGRFDSSRNFAVGEGARALVAGQFDRDGEIDLAVVNADSADVTLLFNFSRGTFAKAVDFSVGLRPESLRAADLDGDRDLDLAVGSPGSITLMLNPGDGSFVKAGNLAVGIDTASMVVADLDGKGGPDLAVVWPALKGIVVVLNRTSRFSLDANQDQVPDECQPGVAKLFRRGDASQDGRLNITDALAILLFLFGGGGSPACQSSADADDDGKLAVSDAIRLLRYLFERGGPLPEPFTACGMDPTEDLLGCEEFAPCR